MRNIPDRQIPQQQQQQQQQGMLRYGGSGTTKVPAKPTPSETWQALAMAQARRQSDDL